MYYYSDYQNKLISLRLYADEKYLHYISLSEGKDKGYDFSRYRCNNKKLDFAKEQLEDYFNGKIKSFDIDYQLQGTAFQKAVWHALEQLDYGQTVSYFDIAQMVGNQKAVRAVGSANGKNPLPIIIPCHRVINKNGSLGGYSSGIKNKITLLELEKKYSSI